MPLTKPTRWTNPSLPQLLQIAVFLLYFNAAIGLLGSLGLLNAFSPYDLLGVELFANGGLAALVGLAGAVAYGFAGAMIASEQKIGWTVGVAVAGGAVAIPLVFVGLGVLTSSYVISFMFDVALVALLLHPQSREHQRIWFS